MPIQPNRCPCRPEAIIFDFDGVLVESLDVKTNTFRELLKDYPQNIEAFIKYHIENGGVSRFEKIKFFFKELRAESISKKDVLRWADRYSRLVVEQVVKSKLVEGAQELLKFCRGRYLLFVVSGTPEEELKLIIQRKKLGHFFKGIFGSPAKKTVIVQKILSKYKINPQKSIFIGDARTDLAAARVHGMAFIARLNDDNKEFFQNKTFLGSFKNLRGVRSLLQNLEKVNV